MTCGQTSGRPTVGLPMRREINNKCRVQCTAIKRPNVDKEYNVYIHGVRGIIFVRLYALITMESCQQLSISCHYSCSINDIQNSVLFF